MNTADLFLNGWVPIGILDLVQLCVTSASLWNKMNDIVPLLLQVRPFFICHFWSNRSLIHSPPTVVSLITFSNKLSSTSVKIWSSSGISLALLWKGKENQSTQNYWTTTKSKYFLLSQISLAQCSPQEEAGGVEHAVQGGKAVRPLASLLHPEEHVLAQTLQLRNSLSQLLGGCGVAFLVHPLRRLPQLGGNLLLIFFWHHQLVFVLVQLVLEKEWKYCNV